MIFLEIVRPIKYLSKKINLLSKLNLVLCYLSLVGIGFTHLHRPKSNRNVFATSLRIIGWISNTNGLSWYSLDKITNLFSYDFLMTIRYLDFTYWLFWHVNGREFKNIKKLVTCKQNHDPFIFNCLDLNHKLFWSSCYSFSLRRCNRFLTIFSFLFSDVYWNS